MYFYFAYCCSYYFCKLLFPVMHGKLISFFSCIGSGKSYLAKVLRDLEVENGGNAPRIHSMDDYFMIEVEKVISHLFNCCQCAITGTTSPLMDCFSRLSLVFTIFFIRAVGSVIHLSSCPFLKGRGY